MTQINENYLKLKSGYLFPEIGRRVREYTEAKKAERRVIRLGIGDVTLPLPPSIVQAMKNASEEMGTDAGFHGYGPEQGYSFLIQKIIEHDFKSRGVDLEESEVFVSDGSKCDSGNIQELFSADTKIAVVDPVYPVYVDTNVMAGRSGEPLDGGRYTDFIYMPATAENNFQPEFPKEKPDVIYLCYPNNPTGTVITREKLAEWVAYARANNAIIIYDAAYEAFIQDAAIPHSIYEIDGAKDVAIEMRSYSKTAGFTGLRCAYMVVPKALMGYSKSGEKVSMNSLWSRRHTTKFNGVSYVTQKAAEACYLPQGKKEIQERISYYMENAKLIKEGLKKAGFTVYGGENAPYIWLNTPASMTSWEFFDHMLHKFQIVGTPGSGFGAAGEGFFRLSAFGKREDVIEAIERISQG